MSSRNKNFIILPKSWSGHGRTDRTGFAGPVSAHSYGRRAFSVAGPRLSGTQNCPKTYGIRSIMMQTDSRWKRFYSRRMHQCVQRASRLYIDSHLTFGIWQRSLMRYDAISCCQLAVAARRAHCCLPVASYSWRRRSRNSANNVIYVPVAILYAVFVDLWDASQIESTFRKLTVYCLLLVLVRFLLLQFVRRLSVKYSFRLLLILDPTNAT